MTIRRPSLELKRKDIVLAYTFLRIIVGLNYFNHGFTRIGNIPEFAQSMVKNFQGSFLPEFLVRMNAYLVPPIELIVGLLITLGLITRGALAVCFGLMAVLMYGVTVIQDWDTASSQLIYDLVLFVLLAALSFNTFSIDYWLKSKGGTRRSMERSAENIMRFVSRFWGSVVASTSLPPQAIDNDKFIIKQ